MSQGPADNLIDTAKNTFVKPVQNVLNAVDKYTPSWLPGVHKTPAPDPNATKPTAKSLGWAVDDDKKPASTATKKTTTPPKYEKGTDYVPKTGPAILHKGEAVLNKEDADKHREGKMATSKKYDVSDELGGKKEAKPAKEIKHIVTRKAHGGKGHIHTHVHTHPDVHPDEEHVTSGDDEMAEHMMQNMGTPNPGEAEADAGQSGIPAAGGAAPGGAAPTPGAGAPSPMGAQ